MRGDSFEGYNHCNTDIIEPVPASLLAVFSVHSQGKDHACPSSLLEILIFGRNILSIYLTKRIFLRTAQRRFKKLYPDTSWCRAFLYGQDILTTQSLSR
jgi:hypothetical protein